MKKLLTILLAVLMVVSLSACSKKEGDSEPVKKEETKTVKLYKDTFISLLSEDTQSKLLEHDLNLSDEEIALLGEQVSDYTFTGLDGSKVSLPTGKPFMLEIVGSWCGYCQALTKVVLEEKVYNKIPVYQYFLYGTTDEVASFYDAVGVDIPDEVNILLQNQEFEALLNNYALYSVPLTLIVDETGKVALTHVGYCEIETLNSLIAIGTSTNLYNAEIQGTTLYKYIKEQYAAKKYLSEMEEIEVPVSYLR